MIPADQHTWRLSKYGDQNLGLACTEDGLFLGRTPLVERHGRLFTVRPKGDLERVLSHAYGAEIGADRLLPAWPQSRRLCRKTISASRRSPPYISACPISQTQSHAPASRL